MSVLVEFFVTGLTLGCSVCALSCGPMLVLYIAGTREGWREGVIATLVFSVSRLAAYVLLGFLAGVAGMFVPNVLHEGGFAAYIWIGAGIFISFVGVLMMWGKGASLHPCQTLMKYTVKSSILTMVLLGFTVGIASHCGPLLGVLTYIALTAGSPLVGAFYAFCFGLGAAIVTPLLVLGVLASIVPRNIFKSPRIFDIFKRACGLLFLLLGARLIFSAVGRLQ